MVYHDVSKINYTATVIIIIMYSIIVLGGLIYNMGAPPQNMGGVG